MHTKQVARSNPGKARLLGAFVFIGALCVASIPAVYAGNDRDKDYDSLGYGGRNNDSSSRQMRRLENEEREAYQRPSSSSSSGDSSSRSRNSGNNDSGRCGGWQDAGASRGGC